MNRNHCCSHVPEGPREFERIVSRALRKNREERYQTVKDLLIDLKDLKSELETQSQRVFLFKNVASARSQAESLFLKSRSRFFTLKT